MVDQLDIFGGSTPHPPPKPSRVPCPTCHGTGTVDPARLAEMVERPGGTTSPKAPKTSRVAGTTPRKGTGRHLVLRVLNYGPMTARQISDRLQVSPNQVATRLGELHEDLFVEYLRDPETREIMERETTPGNTGMVHCITMSGKVALTEIEGRTWI